MFISPHVAIERGWIKRSSGKEISAEFIQPNAIDFTIDRVFSSHGTAHAFFAADVIVDGKLKTIKQFPQFVEHETYPMTHQEYAVDAFILDPGVFDFLSDFYVELPEGVAALLIVRSTFNRGGNFVTSGLYDSGFCGNIGAALHVNNDCSSIVGKGTRIGQIIFVPSESVGMYSGGYNTEMGGVAAQHSTSTH